MPQTSSFSFIVILEWKLIVFFLFSFFLYTTFQNLDNFILNVCLSFVLFFPTWSNAALSRPLTFLEMSSDCELTTQLCSKSSLLLHPGKYSKDTVFHMPVSSLWLFNHWPSSEPYQVRISLSSFGDFPKPQARCVLGLH